MVARQGQDYEGSSPALVWTWFLDTLFLGKMTGWGEAFQFLCPFPSLHSLWQGRDDGSEAEMW